MEVLLCGAVEDLMRQAGGLFDGLCLHGPYEDVELGEGAGDEAVVGFDFC